MIRKFDLHVFEKPCQGGRAGSDRAVELARMTMPRPYSEGINPLTVEIDSLSPVRLLRLLRLVDSSMMSGWCRLVVRPR